MPRSRQETPELTNTENIRTTSYLYILFLLLTAANPGVNTIAYEVYITYDILCGIASTINFDDQLGAMYFSHGTCYSSEFITKNNFSDNICRMDSRPSAFWKILLSCACEKMHN